MRLLIVEDDLMIGEGVYAGLHAAGFSVDWVRDGLAAKLSIETNPYSLVLLDLGLPRMDGLTLLKTLRQANNNVPVLIITARDAVSDRISGLNCGADDYLVKPFDLDELIARVRALIRRHAGRAKAEIAIGNLILNTISREVTINGEHLHLSAREYGILHALMETPGAVLSKEDLEERIYGWGEEVASNAVEVHLHNLRRKLGQQVIRNVRGLGYKVVNPDEIDT